MTNFVLYVTVGIQISNYREVHETVIALLAARCAPLLRLLLLRWCGVGGVEVVLCFAREKGNDAKLVIVAFSYARLCDFAPYLSMWKGV